MIKECILCGSEFEAKRKNARACSNACRVRLSNGKRSCPGCGEDFYPSNRAGVYCSATCRRSHKFGIPDVPLGYRWCAGKRHIEPESNFARKKDSLQSLCKDCQSESMKQWYSKNKETHKEIMRLANPQRYKKWRIENKKKYAEYLLQNPCVDCGETDIRLLEPDHLRDKKYNISNLLRSSWTWRPIEKELAKCEIVCIKCHRLRTYSRMDYCWRIEYWEKYQAGL